MALTQVQPGMLASDSQYTGFKNRIINGAMVIDQRNAGASVTPTANTDFWAVDRFGTYNTQGSKFTIQRNAGSVTPPPLFTNYLGVTSTSAYSVSTSDFFKIYQYIEGFNTADLGWGTANAQSVTLSFWVRSSLTGTFGGTLINSAANRTYPFSYTILSANTWEQKSVTITGDTTGTWVGATNGIGLRVNWSLGAGSTVSGTAGAWSGSYFEGVTGATSVVGTNGATFYITGVQLEKGSTATSFDYRPYGTELQLCQRYLPAWRFDQSTNAYGFSGQAYSTTAALIILPFNVPARVKATGVVVSDPSHFGILNTAATALNAGSSVTYNQGSQYALMLGVAGASGVTAGSATLFAGTNTSGYIYATGCEL